MEEQKTKKALASKEWKNLTDALAAECVKLTNSSPLNILAEMRSLNVLKLTNGKTGKQASFTYNPDVPCIFFEGYDNGGHLAFRLNTDGALVQLFDVKRNVPTSVNEITFEVFNWLVQ